MINGRVLAVGCLGQLQNSIVHFQRSTDYGLEWSLVAEAHRHRVAQLLLPSLTPTTNLVAIGCREAHFAQLSWQKERSNDLAVTQRTAILNAYSKL